ncbi:MAG: 16S rRNA (adenine(1518)-N(6)/adenine(1519)-N(6))-dimethyltransferase RsmA [Desulfarculaceae bacterium]|nr:16S rRNA (adenine(1518)-N(6)/adenine(1519)-N(6))-dimethyltransferase RsmA [Desulfarculaceae bacterium]
MTHPAKILKENKRFAEKKLGQNFLVDPSSARMIVQAAGIEPEDTILEIGAGLGALTIEAARKAKNVIAVEKDSTLVPILKKEIEAAGADNIEVIRADVLTLDIEKLAGSKELVIMGNLPYNISSQVLFMLVENRRSVKRAVLMFQKELAERITAQPGEADYSRLSAVMNYCGETEKTADLKPDLFFPKPEVSSRVVRISFFPQKVSREKEALLFRIIKAAFSKRRKTLRNSLAGPELNIDKHQAEKWLTDSGISPERRAQTVTAREFAALLHNFSDI